MLRSRSQRSSELSAGSAAAPETPRKTGADVIAGYLKTLPQTPGVYRMLDAAGEVIYVGKARQLKSRVSNYARLNGHTNRIARMILATASMEFVTVATEAEALLLEANLIKRFRPRFNVLMRDDKSFPYILIARDHRAPAVMKHRGARNRKGEYFGPFASAGAVDRTVRRHHDDGNAVVLTLDPLEQLHAGDARQHEVTEHEIGPRAIDLTLGFRCVCGRTNVVPPIRDAQ